MLSETGTNRYYIKVSAILFAVFIAIYVAEILYKKALFDFSLEMIPRLQKDTTKLQNDLWFLYSEYIDEVC
jgi:hypothetical protein